MKYLLLIFILAACATGQRSSTYKSEFAFQSREISDFRNQRCEENYISRDVRSAVVMANACIFQKKWKEVQELALQMRSHNESSPWGYYYESIVYEQKGLVSQAIWFGQKALEKDYDNHIFNYHMARLHLMAGESLSYYQRLKIAHSKRPDNFQINRELSKIYMNNRDYLKAVKHFDLALNEQRDNELLTAAYIAALNAMQFEKSLSYLNQIPSRQLSDQMQYDKAYLFEKTNQLNSALNMYENVLKRNAFENLTTTKEELSTRITEVRGQLRNIANIKEGESSK